MGILSNNVFRGIATAAAASLASVLAPTTTTAAKPDVARPKYCSMLDAAGARQLTPLGDAHLLLASPNPAKFKAQEQWFNLERDIMRAATAEAHDPGASKPLDEATTAYVDGLLAAKSGGDHLANHRTYGHRLQSLCGPRNG